MDRLHSRRGDVPGLAEKCNMVSSYMIFIGDEMMISYCYIASYEPRKKEQITI